MTTDLPRPTALERFRELDDIRRTLLSVLGQAAPGARPHVQPFHIVHLARCSDLAAASQRTVGGFVTEGRDFSGTRLMVTCDSTRERRAAHLHQMIHAFTADLFTRLRPWLIEGLARYYQTLRVEDTSVVIGIPPPNHLPSDQQRLSGFPDSMQQTRYSGAPNLETLTSMNDAFYKKAAYYNHVGAWRLVHLLSSPSYRDRFVAYLRNLHAGAGAEEAWKAAFGDIGSDRIASAYANYTKRMQLPVYRIRRASRSAVRDPRVQPLRPGEVHALWVQLHMAGKPATDSVVRNAVREHLSSMASEDPKWTALPFWRAVQAYHSNEEGDRAQAERLLRAYVAREPRDFRAWAGLVRISIERAVPADYLGVSGPVPAGLTTIEKDVRELVRSGSTANALNLIAWYYALRRLPRTGLAFAFRAVQADPACGACHETLALLLFQDGRVADSVAAQERAMVLLADDGQLGDVERRLEIYRRALPSQADASR